MKRTVFILTALLLLGCCACGRMPDVTPPAVEIATQPPAPQTDGAPAFYLDALPDIGSFQPKRAECFYDAPLPEFRESASYGSIVPYVKTSNGRVPSYGFMTTDGKIITDDIYSSVELLGNDADAVYSARLKTHFLHGYPEDTGESRWEVYQKNCLYQLIRTDGSAFVSLSRVTPSVWPENSPYITCQVWAPDGGYIDDTYLVYDFDLRLVADLTEYQIPYGRIVDRGAGRFAVVNGQDVLYFENGSLTETVTPEETNVEVFGDYILTSARLYRSDGSPVMEIPADAVYVIDPARNRLYIADVNASRLILVENGGVTQQTDIPENCSGLTLLKTGGDPRLAATFRAPDGGNETAFWILTADLQRVAAVSCSGEAHISTTYADAGQSTELIEVKENGRTLLYDLTGNELAAAQKEDWFGSFPGGYGLYDDVSHVFLLYAEDVGGMLEIPASLPLQENGFCSYTDGDILVWTYDIHSDGTEYYDPENFVLRSDIFRISTGEVLYRGVHDFTVTVLGKQCYPAFASGGMAYVFDGGMRQIAAIPDDYYA